MTTVKTARRLRKQTTCQEAKVWLGLRALRPQGFPFRRQVPIASFIVDLACLKAGLVAEIDGSQNGSDAHQDQDRVRDAILAKAGFRVLRLWNSDVETDAGAVIDTICASPMADRAAARPARPLPGREGRWHNLGGGRHPAGREPVHNG